MLVRRCVCLLAHARARCVCVYVCAYVRCCMGGSSCMLVLASACFAYVFDFVDVLSLGRVREDV